MDSLSDQSNESSPFNSWNSPQSVNRELLPFNTSLDTIMRQGNVPQEVTLQSVHDSLEFNKTLFGNEEFTSSLRLLCSITKGHQQFKDQCENRFFLVLEQHPAFKTLCDMIPDPTCNSMKRRRFHILCRGPKDPTKKRVLNFTLLLISQNLIKKEYFGRDFSNNPQLLADAQYQPNVVTKFFRSLFKVFKDQGIVYGYGVDFDEQGDFPAYWSKTFNDTKALRPIDYAETPNAAKFDPQFREKRAKAIAHGILDPRNDYDHHTWILCEEIQICWTLRGCKEVSFSVFDTVFIPK
jgi:hypothetical protein